MPLPAGTLVCMDAQFLKGSHASLLSEGRSLRRNVRATVLTSSIFSIFRFIITPFWFAVFHFDDNDAPSFLLLFTSLFINSKSSGAPREKHV